MAEIIAELEALRPEGGGKAERTAAEALALDLVADCAGLDRTDLQRIESTLRGLGLPQEFTRNWRSAVREAARAPASATSGEIFSDGRPASWPYLVDERRLWLLSEHTTADGSSRIERTLVADFSATITEEAVAESGAKHWTLSGETAIGLPFTFEIPALEYSDERGAARQTDPGRRARSPVRAKWPRTCRRRSNCVATSSRAACTASSAPAGMMLATS